MKRSCSLFAALTLLRQKIGFAGFRKDLIRQRRLAAGCFTVLAFAFAQVAGATTWYVTTNGTGDGSSSWANATNSIQGAIDNPGVVAGDTVLVSNGV